MNGIHHEDTQRAVERVARESYGRLVAYLSANTHDLAAAEDALSEALLKALRVWPQDVHAVILGPVDTDMNCGFNIPKVSTEFAATGIFDGLEKGEEQIFPDPASQSIAKAWRDGVSKALERQFAAFMPQSSVA